MNLGGTARLAVAGALLATLGLTISPAEAQRYRRGWFFDPPYPAQTWRSDRTRSGRRTNSRGTIADVPLPPRRPAEFAAPAPALASPQPQAPTPSQTSTLTIPAGDDAETCAAVLAAGHVAAEASPPIRSGACGIDHPLMLKAIVLADKRQIKLEPPVAMRCRLAEAIAAWIIEDVAPAIVAAGKPLEALSGVGAYECRGRNGVPGAKLSEHAIGNAFDISALKLTDGHIMSVQEQKNVELFEKVRASACARFMTVLGPGSDAAHKTHLHVDLQERRHGYKMCQWDVAPKAPPAPAAADQAPPPADKPAGTAEKKNEQQPLSPTRASARRR
ncbi:MAG: extensin family protein [Methylobacteriaceae bacterium]|nr:extensin family protein [Methylobacteriaceae bacterium]